MAHDPAHLFSPEGAVARSLGERFESRPQQIEMAQAVTQAMSSRSHLLVEAGTGVGKSFAYLAPAIERAMTHNERVIIATNTIALQEQLLEKDAPLLQRALGISGDDLSIVLVKGRGNYLSIRRLQMAGAHAKASLAAGRPLRSLRVIEQWADTTSDGSLTTAPKIDSFDVWDRVRSDAGNCMGRRCPTYGRCFYQNARRQMEGGDILICNHALFFSDLAMRMRDAGFLPPYDHVVLDEAHSVEDVVSEHFGLQLGEGRIRRLLSLLFQSRTSRGMLSRLTLKEGGSEPIDAAIRQVDEAGDAATVFYDALEELVSASVSPRGASMRIKEPGAIENTLTPAFRELSLRLRRLKEAAQREDDRFELNGYAERAASVAVDAELLVDQQVEGCAYWAQTAGASAGRSRRITLACSPVEVAPILRQGLFDQEHSVVLTSATLTTGKGSFKHITNRLGCEAAETLALGSPFDHAKQVELHIDRSMPEPRSCDHFDALIERIVQHICATQGGAFVLFTSLEVMRRAAERLDQELDDNVRPILVQERDGARGKLLERFRQSEHSVLLGVASFWQGVDVPGNTLRNIIITRLPFDPPGRPLNEARLERITELGGNGFMDDTLPRAVIRFKQGFGRLIRSGDDHGRVVVLDSRITNKRYGKAFLSALPQGVVEQWSASLEASHTE